MKGTFFSQRGGKVSLNNSGESGLGYQTFQMIKAFVDFLANNSKYIP